MATAIEENGFIKKGYYCIWRKACHFIKKYTYGSIFKKLLELENTENQYRNIAGKSAAPPSEMRPIWQYTLQ